MNWKQLEAEVDEEWIFWRPIAEGVLSYTEASGMYEEELAMVNLAINKNADIKYGK